jgi:hypothetical protein
MELLLLPETVLDIWDKNNEQYRYDPCTLGGWEYKKTNQNDSCALVKEGGTTQVDLIFL